MSFPEHAGTVPRRSNVQVIPNVFVRDPVQHRFDDKLFRCQVRGQRALKNLIEGQQGGLIQIKPNHIAGLPSERQREEFHEARFCGARCGRIVHGPLRKVEDAIIWGDIGTCYCQRDTPAKPFAGVLERETLIAPAWLRQKPSNSSANGQTKPEHPPAAPAELKSAARQPRTSRSKCRSTSQHPSDGAEIQVEAAAPPETRPDRWEAQRQAVVTLLGGLADAEFERHFWALPAKEATLLAAGLLLAAAQASEVSDAAMNNIKRFLMDLGPLYAQSDPQR